MSTKYCAFIHPVTKKLLRHWTNSDSSFVHQVYRKTTHRNKYLSFDTHHPLHYKSAVAKTLFNRAVKISCTCEDTAKEDLHEGNRLSDLFHLRGMIHNQKSQKVGGETL